MYHHPEGLESMCGGGRAMTPRYERLDEIDGLGFMADFAAVRDAEEVEDALLGGCASDVGGWRRFMMGDGLQRHWVFRKAIPAEVDLMI